VERPNNNLADHQSELNRMAARQLRDYDRKQPGTLFETHSGMTVDDAYALQTAVTRLREERGERVIGYKVGCTSPAIQQQFGFGQPVFGRLWNSECHVSGVQLPSSQFAQSAIEGEFAVCLAANVNPGASVAELMAAIESVFPVIELHNYVFRSASPTAAELIANNAIHAGIVRPRVSSIKDIPLSPESQLVIEVNGVLVESFRGSELGDTVLRSLRWLADILPQHGLALAPGQIILTGSLMRLIPVSPNSHIRVEGGRWGAVETEIGA
jgi:2-keto-4-pentenoate hydratase